MKLSSQEYKDLHKYTKFFALKSAQIIVQSRLGHKIVTPCKPNIQCTDWVFNLNITDDHQPEIINEARKILNVDTIPVSYPLCVEILLETTEGDTMILEYWCLNMLPEPCDSGIKIVPSVYNRLGVLLKSLISVTRVTPAYKLSRRQGQDSYIIMYKIYTHEPNLSKLGEGYKSTKIGQICTPIGTVQFSVDYRTKMTISPTQTGKNNSIMVKSDHFNSNANTRRQRNNEDISDLTKPMRPGPFADPKPKLTVEPQLPGVTRLLAMAKQKSRLIVKTAEIEASENAKNTSSENLKTTENTDEQNNKKESSPARIFTSSTSSRISTTSNLKLVDDEYWMKEMNAPFATRGPVGELMSFYRQCKKSPPLQSPQKNPTPEEITQMIEMYESQLPEYEALVESFCESPDNM